PAPRPLPSFPTRRSSDLPSDLDHHISALGGSEHRVDFEALAILPRIDTKAPCPLAIEAQRLAVAQSEIIFAIVFRKEGAGKYDEDRKSTRLNSSHVKISY